MKKINSLLLLVIGFVLGAVAVYYLVSSKNIVVDISAVAGIITGIGAIATAIGKSLREGSDSSSDKSAVRIENSPNNEETGVQSGIFNQKVSGNISNSNIKQQIGVPPRRRPARSSTSKPKASKPKSKTSKSKKVKGK